MTHLFDKTQTEVEKAYKAYCEEALKAETFYDATINALLNKNANNGETDDEGIMNYNHMNLIMCWVGFERYVKDVATSLFQCKGEEILNPDAIGKKDIRIRNSIKDKCKLIQGKLLSFSDLYEQSQRFTSINTIKENIFQEIVKEAGKGRADVSTYISFIRLFIPDENKNPYSCSYEFAGEKRFCDFDKISAIREIRNSLIHDGGFIKEDAKAAISKYREFENDVVHIDVLTLKEIREIINRVAQNIYEIVTDNLQQEKNIIEIQELRHKEELYESALEQCLLEKSELEERIFDLEGILDSIRQDIEEWCEENYPLSETDYQNCPLEED